MQVHFIESIHSHAVNFMQEISSQINLCKKDCFEARGLPFCAKGGCDHCAPLPSQEAELLSMLPARRPDEIQSSAAAEKKRQTDAYWVL